MKASRDLSWESCYEGRFECARLDVSSISDYATERGWLTEQVPMDWQNPSEEERVILGVMKRPAKTTENLMPPLFINPGVSYSSWIGRHDIDRRNRAQEAQASRPFRLLVSIFRPLLVTTM